MMDLEAHQTAQMRYFGKYRAFVRDTQDPQQRYRLRAYCPAVMGTQDDTDHWLDWADGCFSTGGMADQGDVHIPQVNAGVWVEFEQGDVEHPIWSGCWYAGADPKASEVPLLAKGVGDETTQSPKGASQAQTKVVDKANEALIDGPLYQENPSPFSASYPHNRVVKTAGGHVLEIDDTEGQERIHLYHTSGSYVEMTSDGSVTQKTLGRRHDIARGRHIVHDASRIVVVDGELAETINGICQQSYLGTVARWLGQTVNEYYRQDLIRSIMGDHVADIGGSRRITTAANDLLNVTGSYSRYIAGPVDFTSLEKFAFTAGNASQSSNAWAVTAITGSIEYQALVGDIKFTALAGKLLLSALAQGLELMATQTVKMQGMLGVTVDGGPVGVTVGTGAAEPFLKGQTVATAATNLATAIAAGQLASPVGPVPLAPIAPAFQAFATAITAALSPLNKVA
jgi:hypothetical protein